MMHPSDRGSTQPRDRGTSNKFGAGENMPENLTLLGPRVGVFIESGAFSLSW